MNKKLLFLLVLLLTATTGAMAQDYYAPSTDEVIILNEVYNASNSGYSSHSAIAWGGAATTSNKKAGDPNKGGQPTSSNVICYSVKGTGQGKNITLSITGVSKVIVYYHGEPLRYIELRDGSKGGNIIGSGEKNTYYTEVELTATNKYSIFLHGTSNGSDDVDFYVYAIKLIAAPAATYSVTLAEGTEDATNWQGKAGEGEYQSLPLEGVAAGTAVSVKYSGKKKVKSVKAVKKAAAPSLNITSPEVGQVIGSDGKNYAYGSLPTGVTAVAKICYVSGSNGLALALTDEEGKMNWSTAIETCAAHTPAFTGGTWKLASKDEWSNMISAAGSYTNLRNGFSSVGGTNMQEDTYWSSTERDSDDSQAWVYFFNFIGNWSFGNKEANAGYVRPCLAF
jgi:hypothetical protein